MTGKKIVIILVLIIVGLGLLAGGFLGGVLYQKEKAKCLGSSKIIPLIMVIKGQVTKISGKTVTLSDGTENFLIDINENAPIYSFSPGNQAASSFEAIKAGDNLDVSVKMLPDGQLNVLSVIIYRL